MTRGTRDFVNVIKTLEMGTYLDNPGRTDVIVRGLKSEGEMMDGNMVK